MSMCVYVYIYLSIYLPTYLTLANTEKKLTMPRVVKNVEQ